MTFPALFKARRAQVFRMPISLFQLDLQQAAFLDHAAGLAAVRDSIRPEHVTEPVRLHRRLTVRTSLQPGTGAQENDHPVGMGVQGNCFSCPVCHLENPHTLVLQQRLIDMWRHANGIERW